MADVRTSVARHGGGAFWIDLIVDDVTGAISRIEWACTSGTGTAELLTATRTLGTLTVLAGESGGRNVPNRYNRAVQKGVPIADEASIRTTWSA